MSNKEANITENAEAAFVKSNRILSLSGGGVKGIAELVVLTEIEECTGKSITELFPIITGTSVGGLIAGLLTIPKEPGSREAKYSAREALEIFKEAAPKIFENHWYDGIKQKFTHRHSQHPLKALLQEYLADLRLNDSTSRLIIPVTDLTSKEQKIKLFDSIDSYSLHIRVSDVLLATTAAPTYFKSVSNLENIKGYSHPEEVGYAYADGGLGANRPAYEALKLLKSGKSREQQAEILDKTMVLSLNFDNDINGSSAVPKIGFDGAIGWLVKGKLVDRLINGSEDTATEEVKVDLPGSDEFIEVKLSITKETSSLDDASLKNIIALEEVGRKYIREHSDQLQKLCDNLLHNVEIEQSFSNRALNDKVDVTSDSELGIVGNRLLDKDDTDNAKLKKLDQASIINNENTEHVINEIKDYLNDFVKINPDLGESVNKFIGTIEQYSNQDLLHLINDILEAQKVVTEMSAVEASNVLTPYMGCGLESEDSISLEGEEI